MAARLRLATPPPVWRGWSKGIPVGPCRWMHGVVNSTETAQTVGVIQIQALAEARKGFQEALDILACDGKYGNAGFLRSVKAPRCGIVTRLRCDRVLYHPPPPRQPGKRGHNKMHGERFAFKETETWDTPDDSSDLEGPYWGKVRLER